MKAVNEHKMRHVLQDVGFLLVARNKAQKFAALPCSDLMAGRHQPQEEDEL